ncbi:phosphatidate cytidylyltransferase [Nicoliella spurrieriana]|uniref:Phosphatidate cytidylyltransferase n=1 Tax=Nicoliella spurrieriana TaxID=2925830 RepID=A0A976RRN4_9LACO|nr:phosphatidate cytidylyltransferase [Nicoliella spurrieriana]UQS86500.1 phosphatidate cytidylyltransferase [Nicoliella spurrieriana]
MKQRVITAVVALCIFIPLLLFGNIPFGILTLVMGMVAIGEILLMKKMIIISPESIITFLGGLFLIAPPSLFQSLPGYLTPTFIIYIFVMLLLLRMVFTKNRFNFDDVGIATLAMLYVGIGFHYLIVARATGINVVLYALLIVWTTDSGAYIFGRKFGKHKLAPHISPNKTWEGSIGGSLLATVIGTLIVILFPQHFYSIVPMIIITIIASIGGQFGDLVESALKRHYGVKDSGKILPGHGGILDRFDSLLFVLPILHLFNIF